MVCGPFTSGPLEGIEGVLVRLRGTCSGWFCRVEILQNSVAVEVNAAAAESVAKRDVAHAYEPRVVADAGGPLHTALATVAMPKGSQLSSPSLAVAEFLRKVHPIL